MKRPITSTTVIALALGTAAVVAPTATADEYGLAGKDGTGIITRDNQMASDIGAGSCLVSSIEPSGSQSGVSWAVAEPGIKSPDKTLWGYTITFDNSYDRTFSDWLFNATNINARKFLDPNPGNPNFHKDIPALEAGHKFYDWNVTHTAEENAVISKGGRSALTLTIPSQLTDEKVAQFAQATADNPVRYVWLDHYLQENTDYENQITKEPYTSFSVNPWPNENNECNPITTTWDKIENHVITPGEETKVGTINVPALANGSSDDSLSRMVVEAYGTDGKVIGTSDTTAGDKNRLRIADNGDVFFTWPDYRDLKNGIADDRTVNFRTIALPRTVEQLQTAAHHASESEDIGFASESSNSLPRYNTPNEIDKHTISLDDTSLHDPRYDEDTRSIVSGIIDGSPSNERKEIVLNQVGNLISDMVEREDEPNNKVKVELDKKYVYPGWDAEFVDPKNGNYDVKVTAPANPRVGSFARPVIKVSYTNGSVDEIPLFIVVDPNHTQQMDLSYDEVPVATPGETQTVKPQLSRTIGDGDNINPAKYELDTTGLPDGWTAEVNQDTGEITVTPSKDAPNGEQFVGKLTATYPDGTTDVAKVDVTAVSAVKSANYDAATLSPGTSVELRPIISGQDAAGGTDGPAPAKYTFADGKTTIEQDGITFTIDPKTGVITADTDKDLPNGTHVKIPVSLHYEVGPVQTTNAEVIAVVAPTRPVPFEVETVFDDTIPAGEARITREGVQGVEAIQPDGSWKVTTKPVNAQVTVGTKPSIATATQSWTLPIPFDTERRANPELKPGETRVVQEGKPGERSLTVNVTAEGDKAEIVPETVTTEPVTEIIEYGPDNNARESVTTRTLPFETKIIYDPELPEGTNQTEQEGKNGTVTTTATQRVVDGKPEGDPVITEDVTEPVEMIVRVGTKKVATDVTSDITQPVTPTTRVIYDPELPAGEVKEDSPGKDGEKTVTVTRTVVDGKAGEPVITEKVTKEPEDRVLRVGTKPSDASENVTWTAEVPFDVETRPNSELKPGEIKVVQKGVPGEKTYTADFTANGNEATVKPEEKQTKDPVKEIIEYGPASENTSVVTKVEKPIPFDTEIIFDDTLDEGVQKVDQQGETGVEVTTSTQRIKDGKPSGEPIVTTEQTKAPKNAKIRVGTKTIGETEKTIESEVPFGVKVEFDPNLPAGTSEVATKGKPGKKTTTVTQKVTNSQPDGKALIEEKITEEPVDQIIKVGTKPSEAAKKVEWKAQVPFDVETRPNQELKPGEIKVVQKGVPGEKTYTADFTAKGDETSVKPDEKQTKAPVNEIIEYGPSSEDTSVVTKVEKSVPFETEIVFDDTLEEGEQKVDQQGETGIEVVTSTQKIVEGKPSGDPEVSTKRTKEPKKQIIRVGTKTVGKNTESVEAEVPYAVKVVYDSSLKPGESKVTQEGKPGKKKVIIEREIVNSQPGDPKITEKIIEDPVEKIIAVGTKPAEATDKATWVAPLPYDTIVRVNPDLKPGELKTVQKGEYGEKEFTADFAAKGSDSKVNTSEKVTKKPIQQIIEYGPGIKDNEIVTKLDKSVPFDTEIIFDPNLKVGDQVVDKQGKLGTEIVTSTQKIVDGKPSGDPVVTTERVKDPVNAVIRVGAKTEKIDPISTDVNWVEMTPFETEIRMNSDLQPGETKVVQEGASGKIKHSIKVTVGNNGKVSKDKSSEEISKPSPRIIEVGPSKKIETELTDKYTVETPYETLIEYDPNLEAGEVVEDQQGITGEKEITKTWTLVDGVAVDDPETSEKVIKDKQDRKIRVGTQCKCEITTEKPSEPIKPNEPQESDPEPESDPTGTTKSEDPKSEVTETKPEPTETKESEEPESEVTEDSKSKETKPEPTETKESQNPNPTTTTITAKGSESDDKSSVAINNRNEQPSRSVTNSTENDRGSTSNNSSVQNKSQNNDKQKEQSKRTSLADTGANVAMLLVFATFLILVSGAALIISCKRTD